MSLFTSISYMLYPRRPNKFLIVKEFALCNESTLSKFRITFSVLSKIGANSGKIQQQESTYIVALTINLFSKYGSI